MAKQKKIPDLRNCLCLASGLRSSSSSTSSSCSSSTSPSQPLRLRGRCLEECSSPLPVSPRQGRDSLGLRTARRKAFAGGLDEIKLCGMQQVAENLWVMRFPLGLLGTQIGRTVSIVRLRTGELVIHSTGPFTPREVDAICKLGSPAWLLDATRFHDSFARVGRAMFPASAYLVPEGFAVPGASLTPAPEAWRGELEVLELQGMPSVREHVFFHAPSRTLIVADLVFNFGASATAWTRFFFRWGAGIRQYPGVSRLFRLSIRDRNAFNDSVRRMMQWDFDRLLVGHGDIIESGGKAKLAAALSF